VLPSLVVVAQRRFCLAAGTRLPVYAAYGCVYVVTALLWLRLVDGVPLASTDILGGAVALVGMGIIVSGWGTAA